MSDAADRPTDYYRRLWTRIPRVSNGFEARADVEVFNRAVAAIVAEAVAADRAGRGEAVNAELLAACKAFIAWFNGWCPESRCCAKSGLPVQKQAEAAVARAEAGRPGPADEGAVRGEVVAVGEVGGFDCPPGHTHVLIRVPWSCGVPVPASGRVLVVPEPDGREGGRET